MKYVLDTNVFNRLVDGQLSYAELPHEAEFVATHIQIDEINATQDVQRRKLLLEKFGEVAPMIVSTESGVWDVSKWGQSKWGDGVSYNQVKSALDALNKNKKNNIQDALIGETAFKNGYGLITSDRNLASVMKKLGVNVVLLNK